MAVPSLLDAKMIRALKERMEARRTYLHGNPKHGRYLLSGRIFCAVCGHNLTGQLIPPYKGKGSGHRYYRHSKSGAKKCTCSPLPNCPAGEIEPAVVDDLRRLLENPAAIERAVKAAVPNHDEAKQRQQWLQHELEGNRKEQKRHRALYAKGFTSDDDLEADLRPLREREQILTHELRALEEALAYVPDEEALRRFVWACPCPLAPAPVPQAHVMVHESLRRWIESVFTGVAPDGKPSGVYVRAVAADGAEAQVYRPKKWVYEIKGQLVTHSAAHSTRASATGRGSDRHNPNRSRRPSFVHRSRCRRGP
jgi:hypothetical protein